MHEDRAHDPAERRLCRRPAPADPAAGLSLRLIGGLSLRRVAGLLLGRLVRLLVALRGALVRLLVLAGLLVLLAVPRLAVLLRAGLLLVLARLLLVLAGLLVLGLLVLLRCPLRVRLLLVGALVGVLVLRRLGHGRVLRRAIRVEGASGDRTVDGVRKTLSGRPDGAGGLWRFAKMQGSPSLPW
ncbi:hypothetical protein GCM10027176_63090 [Actinoallomurus bryophytorum]